MIQRHRAAVENENNVHPLSRKSLRGIVNTKLANLHELEHDGTEENDDRLLIISQSTSSHDSVKQRTLSYQEAEDRNQYKG
jgi:hypothetical protein